MKRDGSTVVRSHIIGCGAYLPNTIVTNADLVTRVDTSDEWIRTRTGITQRHIAAKGEKTSDLATAAAKAALANAGATPQDIDMIVVATTTPDLTFPSVATIVQRKLGMTRGFAFDVQAVCSGFIYAIATADNFIKAGQVRSALVIGADTMSCILDWEDRATCVLFGDGAGAVVLNAGEGAGTSEDRGVLNTVLFSDGRLHDLLYVDSGPSTDHSVGYIRMQGKEVFKHAVTNIAASVEASAAAAGVPVDAIDWLVPHQANQRILDGTAKKLKVDPAKVVSTVALHGNTSAASVPLALATAVADGRIQPGHLVLMEALGAGMTWGASLVRW
ncbi:beta-ketoacyl-ACP synthase III [Rhizomicrobium electricum]|jgi:3-oxoacyl-[acyl-carrier-protein] synthase-3|uniref:Beta-ketoacyl-[acyl-carrier-protein] synthase III n=1 Tax=Rhizomicrobium electricum TaxID=480070 RepID=A0ABP3PRS5_9PROT|nr:beta-ketoacyl-ACP synthase III [Rhizomicrobium electricum]